MLFSIATVLLNLLRKNTFLMADDLCQAVLIVILAVNILAFAVHAVLLRSGCLAVCELCRRYFSRNWFKFLC